MTQNSNASAALSLCIALLDEVTPNLRAASAKVEDSIVLTYFFFNKEYSTEEYENMMIVNTEVFASLSTWDTDFVFKIIPPPLPLPTDVGNYAFSRDTSIQKKVSQTEMKNWTVEARAIVTICQTLFGRIFPTLRATGLNCQKNSLDIFFFLDKPATDSEAILLNEVIEEITAVLSDCQIKIHVQVIPSPQKCPPLDRYAFKRKEKSF